MDNLTHFSPEFLLREVISILLSTQSIPLFPRSAGNCWNNSDGPAAIYNFIAKVNNDDIKEKQQLKAPIRLLDRDAFSGR